MKTSQRAVWQSYHISVSGALYDTAGDRVLNAVVAPTISGWQQGGRLMRFFFIRYSSGGAHIRLRFIPNRPQDAGGLERELSAHVAELGLDVRCQPYEPEVQRYLGAELLELAERAFQTSSEIALSGLQDPRVPDRRYRHGRGMVGMVMIAHAFTGSRAGARRLWKRYANGIAAVPGTAVGVSERSAPGASVDPAVAATVDTLAGTLDRDGELPEPYARWWSRLSNLGAEYRAIAEREERHTHAALYRYLSSLIHMHNNRLGIQPWEERVLAAKLADVYSLSGV
jgi:thiopeptide-type bacteriocin biosynthesis protein